MNESMTISLRAADNESNNPLVRVADYYVNRGWKISQILGCDPALRDEPVLSMLDLDPRARVRCDSLNVSEWIIAVDVYRLRDGNSGRRDARAVKFGPSSVVAPWLDHPVEITAPWAPSVTGNKRKRSARTSDPARLVAELRELVESLDVSWATISTIGRGPAQTELTAQMPPPYVDMSALYLGTKVFDELRIRELAAFSTSARWSAGWFFSTNPIFGGDATDAARFTREAWKELRTRPR